jgi:hypothetical protein
LGEWQKHQLSSLDVHYIIAVNANYQNEAPTAATIAGLQAYVDVEADAWLLDIDGMNTGVASRYCPYEALGDCSVSVTLVIDRNMKVRYIGATHLSDPTAALELLITLANE